MSSGAVNFTLVYKPDYPTSAELVQRQFKLEFQFSEFKNLFRHKKLNFTENNSKQVECSC